MNVSHELLQDRQAAREYPIIKINTTVAGSLDRFKPVVKQAKELCLPVRGYISTAFWCAFEGKMTPDTVVDELTQAGKKVTELRSDVDDCAINMNQVI